MKTKITLIDGRIFYKSESVDHIANFLKESIKTDCGSIIRGSLIGTLEPVA